MSVYQVKIFVGDKYWIFTWDLLKELRGDEKKGFPIEKNDKV